MALDRDVALVAFCQQVLLERFLVLTLGDAIRYSNLILVVPLSCFKLLLDFHSETWAKDKRMILILS